MHDRCHQEHEYVAVLFTGLCADDDDKEECNKVTVVCQNKLARLSPENV
jgi:hypothetical protein